MKERFSGPEGERKLIEALLAQGAIGGNRDLADALRTSGELVEFKDGDALIQQGGSEDSAFFLISGRAEVFVNHHFIGPRESEVVGEMSAIDPVAARSATVKAKGGLVALRVPAQALKEIADSHQGLWRHFAQLVAKRLRDRAKFHLPANEKPVLFIGSSVEGLAIAREIESQFQHDPIIVKVWTSRVFGLSGVPVDDLLRQAAASDFALFVFGPDDTITSRTVETPGPRDNVVFEMGMFIGRLGRSRVYMVHQHGATLKIPSDLLGITPITYTKKGEVAQWIGPVCTELRKTIGTHGVVLNRMKMDP